MWLVTYKHKTKPDVRIDTVFADDVNAATRKAKYKAGSWWQFISVEKVYV